MFDNGKLVSFSPKLLVRAEEQGMVLPRKRSALGQDWEVVSFLAVENFGIRPYSIEGKIDHDRAAGMSRIVLGRSVQGERVMENSMPGGHLRGEG